ncbi:MAG: S41 family peptidase [Patescibacteria group bacterium]
MEKLKIIFRESIHNHGKRHRYIFVGVAVVLTTTAFSLGFVWGNVNARSAGATNLEAPPPIVSILNKDMMPEIKTVDFKMFWDVWNKIQQKYVNKPVKDGDLFYGAIAGMVSSLGDPYTVFLPPVKATRFNQDLAGSFSGIGAELSMKKDIVIVVAPLPESPAEKAGIKAGDKILAVDGKEVYGLSLDEVVNKIRGRKGTPVKLIVLSAGAGAPRDVTIIRDTIVVKSVTWKMMDDDIAYLKISSFAEDTAEGFEQAVRQIGLKNPRALILDLRNNPGGFLDTGVRVASEWIPQGTIVLEKFNDGHQEDYVSNGKHRLADIKTAVLVNQGSASASEIVAGALQDYGKAIVVGEKTFGKGSVQDYEQMTDGSGLKITIAEWLTPNGRSINKNGITPDKVITPPPSTEGVPTSSVGTTSKTLPDASATSTPKDEDLLPKDVVLEEAIKLLK